MCFLCARLAAVGWWHVAHMLTPDPQVEGHVTAFVSQSSQDQTLEYAVYECECNMTKFKLASSRWCAVGDPTHEGPR